MGNPWRYPDEETEDYPGLWVHDGRQSGSITFGRSRLPVWAITGELFHGGGWAGVLDGYGWEDDAKDLHGFTLEDLSLFLNNLLEMRGEFGRLILMLANAERIEQERADEHFANQTPAEADDDGFTIHAMSLEDGDGLTPWPDSWWAMPDVVEPLKAQLRRCLDALEGP